MTTELGQRLHKAIQQHRPEEDVLGKRMDEIDAEIIQLRKLEIKLKRERQRLLEWMVG